MDRPQFVGVPMARNYDDYKYGEAWADGWNDAMEFIFAEELQSDRSKQLRESFKIVEGGKR